MNTPFFSIVTVCLNAASTVEKTIGSVLNQSYPNWEYIIVDGGSTDGTLEIIEEYKPRLARVISEPDKGIYDAFNKGVTLSTGDIVGILNADDQYAPWALSTVVESASIHPECGVFYGKLAFIDEALRKWTVYPLGDPSRLLNYASIPHPSVFVRRNVYKKYGLFDNNYSIVGDWDFLLRLYLEGERFCPIDRVLTAFANSGLSSTPSRRLLRENQKVYFRYLDFMSAVKKALRLELKFWGRKALDVSGTYGIYSRYRDRHILQVELLGTYVGSLEDIWSALEKHDWKHDCKYG
ncbi:MAG: glycosyltransferase [Synergistaceae bacterium]|jgi:glycosyltransferase involved in cell wall biosynthesis|nr:glycosyltransferase [Synergistaceae bacterium]